MLGFPKGLLRSTAFTVLAAVWPLAIVLQQPLVQVGLQVFQRSIQLFAKGDLVELILKGAVEPLTDAVGLG